MADDTDVLTGPDLSRGVPLRELVEGVPLVGHVDGQAVLLIRSGGHLRAVGAHCPHYGAPLAEGLIVDDTIRCPWHHAALSLTTGDVVRPPALSGLACWPVQERGDRAVVLPRPDPPSRMARPVAALAPITARRARGRQAPASVVILGGGAAGDIARWPDPHSGRAVRVEHWVVAERQGQTAARNILGARERFEAVPFFWSAHYDLTIAYVGHVERPERVEIDGDPAAHDCTVRYIEGGRLAAVATIGRDDASLRAEVTMEGALRDRVGERVA